MPKIELSRSNPLAPDRLDLRRIPIGKESICHKFQEFLGPIFHWKTVRGLVGTEPGQKRKAARRCAIQARHFERPEQLPAETACDSQNFLHTSLPACARLETRGPDIRGNA